MEIASITPDQDGDVWLVCIRYPFLNRQIEVNHGDLVRAARLGLFGIKARSFPIGVSDLRSSPSFPLTVVTQTLEEARDLDLILAAGQTMLIRPSHEVLEECGIVSAIPGGYVEIAQTGQHRAFGGSEIYSWTLPCQVVAPPGPDVVGTTMVWQTIFNLYGNSVALVAANPTWAEVLALVADPEDLVVL